MTNKINTKNNQECEDELNQKGEMVERLQVKASSIGKILTSLEKRYTLQHEDFMKKSPSGQQFGHNQPPSKKAHLRIQQIPPFNANKLIKSPSSGENVEIKADESPSPSSSAAPKEIEKIIEE
jgi:hypothetical protein